MTQETMLRLWKIAPDWEADRAARRHLALPGGEQPLHRPAAPPPRAGRRRRARGRRRDARPGAPPARRATGRRRCGRRSPALPDRQRLAIVLRHFEDRPNPEIAAILDASVEAVESLLARARRDLAARLAAAQGRTGVHRWLGPPRRTTTCTPHRDADEAALEPFFAAARAEEPAPAHRAPLGHPRRRRRGRTPPAPRRAARRRPAAPAGAARSSRRSAAGAALAALAACAALGFWLGLAGNLTVDGATAATAGDDAPRARPTGSTPSSTRLAGAVSHGRPRSARRPRLKWALVASLGLNLVFVGLIAGAIFRGPPPPPMPGALALRPRPARALPPRPRPRAPRQPPRLDRPARGAARPAARRWPRR